MSLYFANRLFPPRKTFPADMTAEEGKAMQAHSQYWRGLADQGVALVVGPVFDPNGSWGLAVVQVEQAEQLEKILGEDPIIKANLGFRFESSPMPNLILGKPVVR